MGNERLPELELIYRSSLPSFIRVATAITGDEGLAADAVHDAFVSCVRAAAGFTGEGTLEAWVWRAVINSALRLRRDRRREVELEAGVPAHSANGHGDELAAVRLAVALLPERQRLVLFLRYYADFDYRTIATALGITTGTVGAALSQAHASLRASLTKEVAE
jgi:RNA polymerase sigma factor (sigma-70 family)